MKEIVLDTETTGLSVKDGHRIVEIGCIELDNLIPTQNKFHCYLNPQRKVSEKALEVHGYTDEFLSTMKGIINNKSMIIGDLLRLNDRKVLKRDYIPIVEDSDYKGNLWVFQDVTLEDQYKQRIELEKNKYRDKCRSI